MRAGQFAAAERLCAAEVARAPSAQLWYTLGTARHQLGRCDDAIAALRAARECAPDNASIASMLAALLEERGDVGEALSLYEAALGLDPALFPARLNRGVLCLKLGKAEEALAEFDALAASTRLPAAHINRARALFALFRDREALAAAEAALALAPDDVLAWYNKALALSALGELDAASAAFERAQRCDPRLFAQIAAERSYGGWTDRLPEPLTIAVARGLQQQAVCDWSARERTLEGVRALAELPGAAELARHHVDFAFDIVALPLDAADQQHWARHAARAFAAIDRAGVRVRAGSRIRVGILSPDFRNHPMAWLTQGLFRGIDRGRFELFGYALNPGNGDPYRAAMAATLDGFADVSRMRDAEVARRITADQVEVLIECGGYCEGTRPGVLARRPAPLQASYLGMPMTLGADFIDYRFSDGCCTPPAAQVHWTERLVLLPETHLAYDPPPALDATPRDALGLPRDGFVFCCMSNPLKIEPVVFRAWMQILREVPDSMLWLFAEKEPVRSNLRTAAHAQGVDPARLAFAGRVPHGRFVADLAQADLFLDTLYFSAHTTALDALWAGVPVLACPGETMASRLAASLLSAARMPELVAPDRESYVQAAIRLGNGRSEMTRLRERAQAARTASPLFDTPSRVRAFERALIAMIERQRAGLPPDTLVID